MARSAAAMLQGYLHFHADLNIASLLLNKVLRRAALSLSWVRVWQSGMLLQNTRHC